MDIKVCLDVEAFSEKPDLNSIIRIQNRIANKRCRISIDEFIDEVGNKGKSFTPAVFSGSQRRKSDVEEMQLFVLDFDLNSNYESIKNRLTENGIAILFSYRTLSDSESYRKFRIVLCHEVPIINNLVSDMMLGMLKMMFPEADRACFEISRLFLGGKGVIENNTDTEKFTFRLNILAKAFQKELYVTNPAHYSRSILSFSKLYKIRLLATNTLAIDTHYRGAMINLPDVVNLLPKPYIYIEMAINSPNIVILQYDENIKNGEKFKHHNNECKDNEYIRHIGIQKIYNLCKLSKEFFSDTTDMMEHNLKFLLATNYIHIQGMERAFYNKLNDLGINSDKWRFDIRYAKDHQYKPQRCEGNCPYAAECDHGINICDTIVNKRIITRNQETQYVSVEESYRKMDAALREAINLQGNDIILIKGQTGLGKSHAYMELLKEVTKPVIIAVPTTILKNEVANKINLSGGTAIEAMSQNELHMPQVLQNEVESLYARGLFRDARKAICDYKDTLEDGIEKKRYLQYLQFRDELEEGSGHIVMTHAYLLQLPDVILSKYQIIIDEDILMTMLQNMRATTVEDIKKILESGNISGKLADDLRRLLEQKSGSYRRVFGSYGEGYISRKTQDELGISTNVNELFSAGAYYIEEDKVQYFAATKFTSMKVIIMSATLDEAVYRLFFNSRKVRVYDTPPAHYKGKLIQYTKHSMSRDNITRIAEKVGDKEGLFKKLLEMVSPVKYAITFKNSASKIPDDISNEMYFGNAAGIDKYKGQNGVIIGTPHLTESSYKLVACYLGINVENKAAQIGRREVDYHGAKFSMMTYENPQLRDIQLYMIGSNLEQCIGRSRLLREDATVYLFSNFPCEQAELRQMDYLEPAEETQ